jgi:hypothetical protein
MRSLLVAGLVALIVTGLVPAVGAVLMSVLEPATVTSSVAPEPSHRSAGMLGNARAVSWISSGHIEAP